MVDVFSSEKRSEIMSRIRSKETGAEKIAFSDLRKHGIYFQKHYSKVEGKPDIALPRKKKAVFIDSEFWHGKTLAQLRKARGDDDFWVKKIQLNVDRDTRQRRELKKAGWKILVVWEKDLKRKKTRENACQSIRIFLTKS